MELELAKRRRTNGMERRMFAWEACIWTQLREPSSREQFLRTARAASTIATYDTQRRQFLDFCDRLGARGDDRFTSDVLCRLIMGRSDNGYKLSTIELGLHAIGDWLPWHLVSDTRVVVALRAAARKPASVRRSKGPILLSLLRRLVPDQASYWSSARCLAAMCLCLPARLPGWGV